MVHKIEFHQWPLWNYHFPQLDVRSVNFIRYRDAADDKDAPLKELPESEYRLTGGRNGVCGLHFLKKNSLPKTQKRADAIVCEYEV